MFFLKKKKIRISFVKSQKYVCFISVLICICICNNWQLKTIIFGWAHIVTEMWSLNVSYWILWVIKRQAYEYSVHYSYGYKYCWREEKDGDIFGETLEVWLPTWDSTYVTHKSVLFIFIKNAKLKTCSPKALFFL